MKLKNQKEAIGGKMKKKNEWYYFKKNLPLTMITLPTLIIMFIFNYIPLYGLVLPFKNFSVSKGVLGSPWCGLKNFGFLVQSGAIVKAIQNTVLYNFSFIIFGTIMSVILALMMYELSRKSIKVYQTSLLIPYFMSWVVVAYIVNALLDMDNGMINGIRQSMGLDKILWYSEKKYWPFILIFVNVWKNMGYNTVVYFAALMGIDESYFEAAQIDGANKLQQIRTISLPLIKNIVTIMVILNIGKIFYGDFGLFYNVPLNSSLLYDTTDVVDTYVYRSLINLGNVGMSSTTGFCQSILGFILVLSTNLIVKRIDPDSALF